MSMSVLFSNPGDEDCMTLKNLWKNVESVKLIEINNHSSFSHRQIIDAISQEDDFLLFCGHGTPWGLLNPCWASSSPYLFTGEDVKYIKAKQVFAIWCYAKDFWKNHVNKGFSILTSSMYISNSGEARNNGFPGIPQEYINETNNTTFKEMNQYIIKGLPPCEWKQKLMESLDTSNAIDAFNRKGMTYFSD